MSGRDEESIEAGEEILGRYVVERELGHGGMGVVYGCFDKVGGVRVAVKCLPPELGRNSVEMEEVRENFRLVVGLRHSNIAGVRTLERDARGKYYLVMDVAKGVSLRRWLRRKAGERGPGTGDRGIPLEEAIPVLRQVASALDYAHGEKVVHRDVKPGNVMIDARGRVKVLDFGLAAQIQMSMSRASHAYRRASGTGPYMAPEQWRGRRQDGKTDQYALGVMAYEMLAGYLPFENIEVPVLREMVLKEEPEDIPGVPEGAMAAIRRAMAKSAEDRFPSCGAFVEALEPEASQGRASTPCEPEKGTAAGTTAGMPPGTTARPEGSPHYRSVAGWVAAAVLAAAVGAGVWVWQEHGGGGGGLERLAGMGNAAEETARPEDPPHQRTEEEAEAEKRAAEERLAAERQAEEERLAAERAAEEERLAEEEARRREEARERELEETVYRLAAEAKSKVAAMAEYDRGQEAGERLEEAKLKLLQGEAAIQGRNFGKAKEWLEESLAEAEAHGRAVAEARAEKVRQGLLAAQSAERRSAWEEVLAAAGKVLELEEGNADAQRLKEEAKAQLKPILLVTATMQGGRAGHSGESGALLKVGAQTYTLPKAIDCSGLPAFGPGEVTLQKEGKEYAGTLPRMTVDWKGQKPVAVPLDAVVDEASLRQAGETKSITLAGGATMEMVWCPPGSFTMGSPPGEDGRGDNETRHPVTLTKGFWMAKTEVTQAQWRSVMGSNPSYNGDDWPADSVSWEKAQEFCRKAGHGLQLPTEAQWEYACRAGSTGAFGGTGRLEDMGWYHENSDVGSFFRPCLTTHPVGKKQPNAWGLHDMHGNVWEWCADRYVRDLGSRPATDPRGPDSGSTRAYRGGSFADRAKCCRSAFRSAGMPPSFPHPSMGLRPVSFQP